MADISHETVQELNARLTHVRTTVFRQLWLVAGIFIAVTIGIVIVALLLIPPGVASSIRSGLVPETAGDADFLKLFFPLFVLAFGFALGFLGLKRLEQFDAEINSVRSSLAAQLVDERKLTAAERESFRAHLNDRVAEIRHDIQVVVERYVRESLQDRDETLAKRHASFVSETELLIERVETELAPYSWLREREGQLKHLTGVLSVGVAHDRVTEFFQKGMVDLAIGIADHAIDARLPGTSDDYHNLASELARHDQEPMALTVVQIGLDAHQYNVDLLSDGIKFATAVGDLKSAENLYERLKSVDYSVWNWRAFVFAGDYLEAIGRVDEALDLYEAFRKQIPEDERGYSQPGGYFYKLGRYSKALEFLTEGVNNCARAPQCGLTLAEVYFETGQYEQSVGACDRTLESIASEQPSVNQSAVIWRRATAQDSLLHQILSPHPRAASGGQPNEISALAESAISDYETALSVADALPIFQVRAPDRVRLIRSLLDRHEQLEEKVRNKVEMFLRSYELPSSQHDLHRILAGMAAEQGSERERSSVVSEDTRNAPGE